MAEKSDITNAIIAIEKSCLIVDNAIIEKNWDELDEEFIRQEAVTVLLKHSLNNIDNFDLRAESKVQERIQGILNYRDMQIQKIKSIKDETSRKLTGISRVKSLAKNLGGSDNSGMIFDSKN